MRCLHMLNRYVISTCAVNAALHPDAPVAVKAHIEDKIRPVEQMDDK